LPAACGGGQKSAVLLRRTAGGQKFLSPKTPFLFACLFWGEPGKIFKSVALASPARVRNWIYLLPFDRII